MLLYEHEISGVEGVSLLTRQAAAHTGRGGPKEHPHPAVSQLQVAALSSARR
jgi:hypothetical protein